MPRKNADLTAAEKRALDEHITRTPADDADDAAREDDRARAAYHAIDGAEDAPSDGAHEDVFDNGASAGAGDAPDVPARVTSGAESDEDAPSGTSTPAAPTTPASGPRIAEIDRHGDPRADATATAPEAPFINTGASDTASDAAPFIDLAKADEIAALIPAGTRVLASIVACDPVISGSGNPMLNYRSRIERVIVPPANVPADVVMTWPKRTIWGRFMFTPPNPVTGSRGTMPMTQKAFEAFGVPWASRSFGTRAEFMAWLAEVAPLFVGAVAEALVSIEKSNPNDPRSYDASGELYPDRNGLYAWRVYTARPNTTLTGAPRPNAPSAAPVRNVPQSIENDEDLPF